MTRGLVIALALFASIGLALAGFGFWCIGTNSGAHWLIDSADNFSGIEVTTAELEGSLLDGLALRGLRIAWEGGEIRTAALKLAIRRFNPFSGLLAIERLEINRLVLLLDEDTKEPGPGTEDSGVEVLLAVFPNWLELAIDRLQVSGFIYRSTAEPDEEVVIADLIAGQYQLADQRLASPAFSYHSPFVELDGAFDWQLALPHLVMTASVYLPETSVDPALLESIAVPARFPSHLELDGDWNSYSGPVRFGVIDDQGDKVWLSARATGSWRGIRFDDLKGRYLGGAIAGNLDMSWIDSYRISGQLSGRELDPSALIEETTGRASFDLSGELSVPYDDQPLQANFDAVIHEARFRGHTLQGRAASQWLGQDLVDLDIDLSGDGAHLRAEGVPAQRVDFDLEVADLAMYHEDLAGKAAASGWLSWAENSLAGEIDGHGEQLTWREISVRRVVFQARHLAGEERVALALSGNDWDYGNLRLNRVNAELSGTLSDHQLEIATETSSGRFTASAHGRYQSGTWKGRVERLIGDETPWGRWSMPTPTDITWDEGLLTINKLPLVADKGARLELKVDSWGAPDRAGAALSWADIDLEWLQPYTDLDSLSGRTEGRVEYIAIAGQPWSISGQLSAHGRIKDQHYDLTYETLELELDWGQDGLQLTGASRSDAGERLRIKATAPGPPAWEWPIKTLEADLHWQEFNLARFNSFLEDAQAEGVSDGNLSFALGGEQLERIRGQLAAHGRVKAQHYDLTFESLELEFDWGQDGLQLTGASGSDAGERLRIKATAPGPPAWEWPIKTLAGDLQWQELNLARFNSFLDDAQAEGVSDGSFSFAFTGDQLERMQGHLAARGRLMQGERELGPRSLLADLSWDDKEFQCSARVSGAKGGHAALKLTSSQRPALAWPDSGQIELKINALSLTALEPLLPQDIDVAGTIDSRAEGRWEPKGVVELDGDLQLRQSQLSWDSDNGQILLPLRDATMAWRWAGDSLNGSFALNLSDYGKLGGTWQLPLPARIPTAFEPDGPLQVKVDGQMQATGILSAIGPWLVQDLRGETQIELAVQGTWKNPDLRGKIRLEDGAAYLPAAGIQLEDIQLHSELVGDRLRVDRLTLRSGSGTLTGQGEVFFDRWQLAGYRLSITGEDFQLADFPELQMTCSPDLVLSGTPDRLALEGSVLIPRLAIRGSQGVPERQPSKDVVMVRVEEQRQELEFATDIQVTVELGEDVTVKSGGVDTRLAGGGILTMGPTGELLARGEIQLVSGSFRAHGVNLKIRQGLLSYQGGVITNPDLRIFAAREVGDVLAGVQVTGNAEAPVITLYSRPTMPERDILGYMLMGRAIKTESQEADMLMMGAGSLLPGYGGGLSELGITEIDIQGLFNGTGGLRLRRKLSEKWEIESNLGVESGIDLYYIIELE